MVAATVSEAELHKNRRICVDVFVLPDPVTPDNNIACDLVFCRIFCNASLAENCFSWLLSNMYMYMYMIYIPIAYICGVNSPKNFP